MVCKKPAARCSPGDPAVAATASRARRTTKTKTLKSSTAKQSAPRRAPQTKASSGQRSKPAERCRGQAAPKEVRQANFRRQPSIATCDRIDRALEQRLYLLKLERHRAGAGGLFHVLGSTGNVYTVNIGTKPSCDCPDFLKGRGPCKHILFIWLRVLQLEEDDYRIWQSALLTSELKSAVEPLFKRRAKWALPLAEKEVQDAFRKATRGDGGACGQETGSCRKPVEGEDCAVCFEAMRMSEEAAGQLVFCWSCGNNFHADCIRRWQQACSGESSRPCPLCRQPWRLAEHVPPGGRILVASRSESTYLNLLCPSPHH
mmetsp:Transcript_104727/g.249363  ORF Transcript_104727/g.249363 Transcript_104727/m.249363 type:complete len:316 (-) Transcript_104727:49-996(-)